jgi:hypothetical protein
MVPHTTCEVISTTTAMQVMDSSDITLNTIHTI